MLCISYSMSDEYGLEDVEHAHSNPLWLLLGSHVVDAQHTVAWDGRQHGYV